jgi:transketolase
LDEQCINTIRFLAIEAVQKAKSGHPGAPMGAAPMAYTLWDRYLKHNPSDPWWPDRDRFVLSPGHASMLLYSLLHLTGYDVSVDDLKEFRQWESKTPGHPEYGLTPGVEMTTGPLGQGFAAGVGMAIAERWLAEHYNRPGHDIVDHHTYAIVSDGDLEEGVSSEAASLAGTLKLGKLIYLYDDNGISIEGDTDIAFMEDVGARFRAYGWHVVGPIEGMDTEAVDAAIAEARAETERPSLIVAQTTIGYGSPNKANTGGVHGEALGEDEIVLTRERLGWTYEPFVVPGEAGAHMREAVERGVDAQREWEARLGAYRAAYPIEAAQLATDLSGELPSGWADDLAELFSPDEKPIATRDAGNRVMNAIAKRVHGLTGGSADLAPSTKTLIKEHGDVGFATDFDHNMHFGVREHAMGSIAGGMALHGGVIPYTATFLIFSDYMRPPMRLAAIMGLRVVYVFTHDSIGLGEDGPTHQPIEQVLGLRSVPNLVVMRPADATETAESWRVALERTDGPTALILTRQGLPIIDRAVYGAADGVRKGAYVLADVPSPAAILIATGSEVPLAIEAATLLEQRGIAARVVSMPSWELFDAQPKAYRDGVLPPSISARVSIEAGTTMGWERYVGLEGTAVGVDHFGASAPFQTIYRNFGITAERAADEAEALVKRGAR